MRLTGALILAFATPLLAQFGGPAILSRGQAPAAMTVPDVSFRPFAQVTGVYDTGLAGVGVDSEGKLGNLATFGAQISAGVSGAHTWRRTRLGLDYRGSFNHYTRKTYYDGTDQSLLMSVTHQPSRHIVLSFNESVGTFARSFGLLSMPQTIAFDPGTAYIPTTDFFDNRTVYLSSQANVTYQKSVRLSFNLGGNAFLTRRRSTALYGVAGGGGQGDVQYRISRRTTIGANYSYSKYKFHGVFSGTDNHNVVATYAVQLTSRLELSAYAGWLRSETKFLQSVPIDPAIAALIGRSTGTIITHRIDTMPSISARLSRTFRTGVAYVSGGHTVTPGNGLFLTSSATSVLGGYTYTGLRWWSFSAQAAINRSKSLGNFVGRYGTNSFGASASRQIIRSVSLVGNLNGRKYASGDFSGYNRIIYTATFGLGFAPGDIPMRLW